MNFTPPHKQPTQAPEEGSRVNVGQLRRTHLLTTYGPGALVDMPEYSVVMGACDYWEHTQEVREPRLAHLLGVGKFQEPHPSDDQYKDHGVVKAFRFPAWCYCPRCGKLGPYWLLSGDKKKLRCSTCHTRLVPSRFVVVCDHGHMEDFPYSWWVHGGHGCPRNNGKPAKTLEVSFSSRTGSLEGIEIRCPDCGARRPMTNCTSPSSLAGYHCRGMRPWVGAGREYNEPGGCGRSMRALNRGASNTYYAVTASSLTIPALQLPLTKEELEMAKRLVDANMPKDALRTALVAAFGPRLKDGSFTVDDILDAVKNPDGTSSIVTRDLLESEYQALTAPNTYEHDLKTVHVGTPEELGGYIDDIVLVPRLREVMALRGFRRISPLPGDEDYIEEDEKNQEDDPYQFTPPSIDSKPRWLPAMELLGEGFLVTIDQDRLAEWERLVAPRYKEMQHRLKKSRLSCTNFSPSFVMLHTLSHVLIRQLSMDCGYSGTSLKERIYSTWPGSKKKMAGILIYTSSSDSDGSLGGLVRQGRPERFLHTLEGVLENASWCSSDPVCSESTAQGTDSLNYAACYACTLLSETSCPWRNCLLDRCALVGTLDKPELGFFHELAR